MKAAAIRWNGRPLGRLVMGCEPLGGTDWGTVDMPMARRAVAQALELGINAFDTADVYGLGRSEEELGASLGPNRHDTFIVTKFGVRWHIDPSGGRATTTRDSSPAYMTQALEQSLRRLRIDAIPLYLVHWPDTSIPLEATLEALETARLAGKVMNYGLSNFDADAVSRACRDFPLAAIEASYNLIDHKTAKSACDAAGSAGAARLGYGPLAQGLLTGKYGRESRFDTSDRRSRLGHFDPRNWDANLRVLELLEKIAARRGVGVAEVALRWVLDSGDIDMAVVGARSPDQIAASANALAWRLDPEEVAALRDMA